MKLNEPLSTSFELDGREYELDLAFDVVLDVFEMLDDDVMNDIEKIQTAVLMLTDQEPESADQAIKLWKYIESEYIDTVKERVIYDRQGNPMPVSKDEDTARLIDFEVDAREIYASFRQAYGINLYEEQGRLLWPEFIALLNGLPAESAIMRIVEIRSWKPQPGDSSEYKAKMRKLQRKYRLDREEEE